MQTLPVNTNIIQLFSYLFGLFVWGLFFVLFCFSLLLLVVGVFCLFVCLFVLFCFLFAWFFFFFVVFFFFLTVSSLWRKIVSHTCGQVARAQLCVNHVQHTGCLSLATCRGPLVQRDSSAVTNQTYKTHGALS